jgi:Rps23 Pro-64 3,4-dihydroxylase Tpa1-like proline 4-hydroxylase|tara:strand:+ start:2400 stop:2996 length:597 start_codon:yes stop_codon:yes gene_type:complete
MEIKEPDPTLMDYIHIIDDVLRDETLKAFYKICEEHKDFEKGKILDLKKEDGVNENIRKTQIWYLKSINEESMTTVHWANFLQFTFNLMLRQYRDIKNLEGFNIGVNDIQVLKYEKTSHYKFHVDDAKSINRCMSIIFFVNDEYEGGELVFKFANTKKEIVVQKKKNRAILWPSNFLYPHSVKPVISGTRYSVVAWAV